MMERKTEVRHGGAILKILVVLAALSIVVALFVVIKWTHRPADFEALEATLTEARQQRSTQMETLSAALKETQARRDALVVELREAGWEPGSEKAPPEALAERAAMLERWAKLANQFHEMLGQEPEDISDIVRPETVLVELRRLEPRRMVDRLSLLGTAEAYEDIMLAARNDGPVEWVGVEDGERVEAGQALVKIDERYARQELESAKAAARLAELRYERMSKLAQSEAASQDELDAQRSTLEQTRAALAIARQRLEDATLYSPIAGVADEIYPEPGEYARTGDVVARLVDASRVRINIDVPEKDILYFKTGETVRVRLPEPLEGSTTGTITRIAQVADEASRSFPLEVTLDNRAGHFRAGIITRVELVRSNDDRAIVAPIFSVLQTQDGPMVYVEEDGVAVGRQVRLGVRRGMEVQIVEGLEAGDRLIVTGQRQLTDGALVRVAEEGAGS